VLEFQLGTGKHCNFYVNVDGSLGNFRGLDGQNNDRFVEEFKSTLE